MTSLEEHFSVFVEGGNPEPKIIPSLTGSIDTSAFDAFRQGIDVQTDAQRYAGTLPKLDTGDDDHSITIITFGQSKEYKDSVVFQEIDPFDPIRHIESEDALIFPVVLDDPGFPDPEFSGGFIEPLAILARTFLLSSTEFEAHDVRGLPMTGNEDTFRGTDVIVRAYDPAVRSSVDICYDDSGFFPSGKPFIKPFNETKSIGHGIPTVLIPTSSSDIAAALLLMTGSDVDSYVRPGYISMTTGFVYDGGSVDSLAFGGLLR